MHTFTRISVQQAHGIIGKGDRVTIVDIRDANSFAKGHIHQAKLLDNENIEEFLKQADKEIPLICYCFHGISSQQAAGYFTNQGFKYVYSIDGGWEKWKATYG